MKKNIVPLLLLASAGAFAQTPGPLNTFKNKEVKVKANNLHALKTHADGRIELTAVVKKNTAEKITLSQELVLQSRIDTTVDVDAENQKKKQVFKESSGTGANFSQVSVDLLKSDVLEVASSDALSKMAGVNTVNKGKIGLKNGLGFAVQKGDINFVTNVIGDRVRTFTAFVAKEELKLKSDEGKNLIYEFHTSNAEALLFEFKESDTYNKSRTATMQTYINSEGDLLLIGKRRPVIKFGKAPSTEDLLPVYYIYKLSPKTMDVVAQSKFAEPLSRGIIYREALTKNGGMILVSAPVVNTGDKSARDANPRNYVFRIIGSDAQLKTEFTHEVPSGFTQFSQTFEMPDNSIVMIAAINEKKKDKYFDQGTTSVPDDACYIITIKDGKVTRSQTITQADFASTYVLAQGEKPGKATYNPAHELTRNVSNETLPDGGMLSVWSINNTVPNGIPVYAGDLALHFSADGKLVTKYWLAAKSPFVPSLETELFKKSDTEFYLLTHVADDKGMIMESHLTRLDLQTKTLGKRTLVGDEKHVVSVKFPHGQPTEREVRFFGFDKSGKEFWTQLIDF